MAVIVRLHNLPNAAGASDVRRFFKGVTIPHGGIEIIGGNMGIAYVTFDTIEDAQTAVLLNGESLNGTSVKLTVSDEIEREAVIADVILKKAAKHVARLSESKLLYRLRALDYRERKPDDQPCTKAKNDVSVLYGKYYTSSYVEEQRKRISRVPIEGPNDLRFSDNHHEDSGGAKSVPIQKPAWLTNLSFVATHAHDSLKNKVVITKKHAANSVQFVDEQIGSTPGNVYAGSSDNSTSVKRSGALGIVQGQNKPRDDNMSIECANDGTSGGRVLENEQGWFPPAYTSENSEVNSSTVPAGEAFSIETNPTCGSWGVHTNSNNESAEDTRNVIITARKIRETSLTVDGDRCSHLLRTGIDGSFGVQSTEDFTPTQKYNTETSTDFASREVYHDRTVNRTTARSANNNIRCVNRDGVLEPSVISTLRNNESPAVTLPARCEASRRRPRNSKDAAMRIKIIQRLYHGSTISELGIKAINQKESDNLNADDCLFIDRCVAVVECSEETFKLLEGLTSTGTSGIPPVKRRRLSGDEGTHNSHDEGWVKLCNLPSGVTDNELLALFNRFNAEGQSLRSEHVVGGTCYDETGIDHGNNSETGKARDVGRNADKECVLVSEVPDIKQVVLELNHFPVSANEHDIVGMFRATGFEPLGVSMLSAFNGEKTGACFVELRIDKTAFCRALAIWGTLIVSPLFEMKVVPRERMLERLRGPNDVQNAEENEALAPVEVPVKDSREQTQAEHIQVGSTVVISDVKSPVVSAPHIAPERSDRSEEATPLSQTTDMFSSYERSEDERKRDLFVRITKIGYDITPDHVRRFLSSCGFCSNDFELIHDAEAAYATCFVIFGKIQRRDRALGLIRKMKWKLQYSRGCVIDACSYEEYRTEQSMYEHRLQEHGMRDRLQVRIYRSKMKSSFSYPDIPKQTIQRVPGVDCPQKVQDVRIIKRDRDSSSARLIGVKEFVKTPTIRKLLKGFDLDTPYSIKLFNADPQNYPGGIVYVRFRTPSIRLKAMKSTKNIDGLRVFIEECSDEEFDNASSPSFVKRMREIDAMSSGSDDVWVELDNLPPHVTTSQIVALLNKGSTPIQSSVFIEHVMGDSRNGAAGTAFVRFKSRIDRDNTVRLKKKLTLGTFCIEISSIRGVDVFKRMYGRACCIHQHGISSLQSEMINRNTFCVQVFSGSPHVTESDVMELLCDVHLKAIHVLRRPDSLLSGDCFVELAAEGDVTTAMSRSSNFTGLGLVTIHRLDREHLLNRLGIPCKKHRIPIGGEEKCAQDQRCNDAVDHTSDVKRPGRVLKVDVVAHGETLNDRVETRDHLRSRPRCIEDAIQLSREVNVEPPIRSSSAALDASTAATEGNIDAREEYDPYVMLTNLPPSVSKHDIYSLFHLFVVAQVCFEYVLADRRNGCTGVCFVRFDEPSHAISLLINNKYNLDGFAIEITPIEEDVAFERMKTSVMRNLLCGPAPHAILAANRFTHCVELKGIHQNTTKKEVATFFEFVNVAPSGIHLLKRPDGTNSGDCFVELLTEGDLHRVKKIKNMQTNGGFQKVSVVPMKRIDMLHRLGFRAFQGSRRPPNVNRAIKVYKQNGCLIRVENLPVRATVEDVLDLFSEFYPVAETVKLRRTYRDVTLEATLAFCSPTFARSALEKKNCEVVSGKFIKLSLVRDDLIDDL